MRKKNCWEKMSCGHVPGGGGGVSRCSCPATTCVAATGINGGTCGGRSCWALDNTLCGEKVQPNFAEKFSRCLACSFYVQVMAEEGDAYMGLREIRIELAGYKVY